MVRIPSSTVARLWQTTAAIIALLLVTYSAGAVVQRAPPGDGSSALALDLPDRGPDETVAPASDGVPEAWILGDVVIDHETQELDVRLRVLPGARLTINASTLLFAADERGPTGLVSEPGSEVIVRASTLAGLTGPDAYVVHLEGASNISASVIDGARTLVAQPRALTDHVDELLGAQLEGQIIGWRVARTLTQGTFTLEASSVSVGAGPALVAGAPVQYQGDVPIREPAVHVRASTLSAAAGPAVLCYVTHQDPDPDAPFPVVLVAQDPFTQITIADTRLESGAGVAVHCPPAPTLAAAPPRTVPPDLATMADLIALATGGPAPAPEVLPGPTLLRIDGGAVRGGAIGVLLDGVTRLEADGTVFEGLSPAVRVASEAASAELRDASGVGLGSGFDVSAGSLVIEGGDYGGLGPGAGVRALGGAASIDGVLLHDFDVGVGAAVPVTVRETIVSFASVGVASIGAAPTLTANVFEECNVGILVSDATGATVTGNSFTDSRHPLHVESADPAASPSHFDHTVSANSVEGLPIAYLFEDDGTTLSSTVGSALVAHTDDARIARLDARVGHYHVVASNDIVIGAPTDAQVALLSHADPALALEFAQNWQGVRFELYPGSLKGPQGALDQLTANDVDKAWLLVDQARALGHDARFVDGTGLITNDAYLDWLGMEDLETAFTILGASGVRIGSTFRMDRTWTEIAAGPGVWLEADPAFIQYEHVAMPEPSEEVQQAILDAWTEQLDDMPIDGGTATSLPFASGQAAAHDVVQPLGREWVVDTVDAAETPVQVFGGLLPTEVSPAREPTRTPVTRYDAVADADKWSVGVRLGGEQQVLYTPDVYGERISVFSTPATEADETAIIDAGGLGNVNRFAVNLVTQVYVDGEAALADPVARHPGDEVFLAVDVRMPGPEHILTHDSPIRVGGGYAIALDLGRTPIAPIARETEDWNGTVQRILDGDIEGIDHDDAILPMFHLQGMYYFNRVGAYAQVTAEGANVLEQPLLGVAVTGMSVVPVAGNLVAPTPPYIDVQALTNRYARDGNETNAARYSFTTGMTSSMWEGLVFEELYGGRAISTVELLRVAAEQGQAIHQVTSENVETILAQTALPFAVENLIRQDVAAGMVVTVHHAPVTVENWTGVGWNVLDPATGLGGWLIFGGSLPLNSASEPVVVMLLSGGSGTGFTGPTVSAWSVIEKILGATLSVFQQELAKLGKEFIRGFKLGIAIAEDFFKALDEPNLNNWGKGCVAAQMAGIDVGLMFLGMWLGKLILPQCIAWALAGGILGGVFGLFAALALCILLSALISLIIGLIIKYIHEALYDLQVDQCRQITDGMP